VLATAALTLAQGFLSEAAKKHFSTRGEVDMEGEFRLFNNLRNGVYRLCEAMISDGEFAAPRKQEDEVIELMQLLRMISRD
jgi:hypothetical protein